MREEHVLKTASWRGPRAFAGLPRISGLFKPDGVCYNTMTVPQTPGRTGRYRNPSATKQKGG